MTTSLNIRTTLICIGIFFLLIQSPGWSSLSEGIGFQFIIIGLIIPLIATLKTDKVETTSQWQSIHWLSALIIAYMIASFFWSEVPYDSLLIFKNYAIAFIIIICGGLIGSKLIHEALFFNLIVASGFVLSIFAIYQVTSNPDIQSNTPKGLFANPNSFAVYLGLCAIICIHYTLHHIEKTKYLLTYAIALIFILNALFLTNCRTAYIALTCCVLLIIWIFKSNGNKATKNHLAFLIFTICGVAILLVITAIIADARSFNTNAIINTATIPTRFDIWTSSINAALSTHPIIGNGIGTFKSIYPYFRPDLDRTAGYHAHNDLIHILVELGLISVCLLIIFIFLTINKSIIKLGEKNIQTAMPVVVLFYCALMSIMTPVILLSAVMAIIGFCIHAITLTSKNSKAINKNSTTLKTKTTIIGLVLFSFLALQNMTNGYTMHLVRTDLRNGDMPGFLSKIELAKTASLGLNPHASILQTAAILSLYDQGLLKDASQSEVLIEARNYLKQAQINNPHNPENFYYSAILSLRENKNKNAITDLKQALDLDPTYIPARIELFNITPNKQEAFLILVDGLHYHYWKSNPMNLYVMIMEEANIRQEPEIQEKAHEKIQRQLQLN